MDDHKNTYKCWSNMKSRCTNPNVPSYSSHGKRGINYIQRWELFNNFLEDMGEKPHGLTLDRIDNNKGYCKENCRWATYKEQNNNRRNNRLFRGKNLTEWSKLLEIPLSTLAARYYRYKWPIDRVLCKS